MDTQHTDKQHITPDIMQTEQAELLLEYIFDSQEDTISVEAIRENSDMDNRMIDKFLYEFEKKGLIICEKRGLFGAPLTYRVPEKLMIE